MLEGSESLSDVTHIIIDEVHERSIDSDFLLIVLREILKVRKDLKCVIVPETLVRVSLSLSSLAGSFSCPPQSSTSQQPFCRPHAADDAL